jgi:hypothetical protein
MTELEVIAQETKEKYEVKPQYVLLECENCHSTWGVSLHYKMNLTPRDLTCRNCAVDKFVSSK